MRMLVMCAAFFALGTLPWTPEADQNRKKMSSASGEPVIREVKPPSARAGERVKIEGEHFGTGVPMVTFNGVQARVIKAEGDEVRVIVPEGATSGPLVIVAGGRASKPVHFVVEGTITRVPTVPPPQPSHDSSSTSSPQPAGKATISFSKDIQPIFDRSCTDCHGGNAGLYLDEGESYANLVNVPATKGCTSEMRVQPGNAEASVLYKRVSGTSCGTQMPKKSPPLSAEEIDAIRRWIDAGAPNN